MREYIFRKKTRLLGNPGYLVLEIISSLVIIFGGYLGWGLYFIKFIIISFSSITSYSQHIDCLLPISEAEKRNYMIAKSLIDAASLTILMILNSIVTFNIYGTGYDVRTFTIFEIVVLLLSFLLMLVADFDQGQKFGMLTSIFEKGIGAKRRAEKIIFTLGVFLPLGIVISTQTELLNHGQLIFINLGETQWDTSEFVIIGLVLGLILFGLFLYEIFSFNDVYYHLSEDVERRMEKYSGGNKR